MGVNNGFGISAKSSLAHGTRARELPCLSNQSALLILFSGPLNQCCIPLLIWIFKLDGREYICALVGLADDTLQMDAKEPKSDPLAATSCSGTGY